MKIELIQVEYLAQCLANNSKYIINVSYHYHADLLLQCLRTYERKGASKKFSKSIFKDNKPGKKKGPLQKTCCIPRILISTTHRFSHIISAQTDLRQRSQIHLYEYYSIVSFCGTAF